MWFSMSRSVLLPWRTQLCSPGPEGVFSKWATLHPEQYHKTWPAFGQVLLLKQEAFHGEWRWNDIELIRPLPKKKDTKAEHTSYCSSCCKPPVNSFLPFLLPTEMHLFTWPSSQKPWKTVCLAHCWQFPIAHYIQMLFYLNQLDGVTAWISDFGAVVFFLIMLSVHLCHVLPWIYAAVFY